ncbi:UNVERIFIED_CONTAM: Transposon Ty3-G Gag-Pol polyprotein [Sesamum radiatum]|uniref:Transposon Ty3-G Gag-Pol polyprotein n=1 Tax=Sesamum radiatum TaxID=300843 RepID=A0AAW2KRW8_SESRA
MADGTRFKEVLEMQKKLDIQLMEEKAMRQANEQKIQSQFDSVLSIQAGLQNSYSELVDGQKAIQVQLKGIIEQIQAYNRNKSVLGEAPAILAEKGSTSSADSGYSGTVLREFNTLKQGTNSVDLYLERFEELKSHVLIFHNDFPESYFVTCFVNGLRADIRGGVLQLKPTRLHEAVALAKNQEATVDAILKRVNPTPTTKAWQSNRSFTNPKPSNLTAKPLSGPTTYSVSKPSPPIRKILSEEEMQARRSKNLCYNCDEIFRPGHKCKQQLMYCILTEDEAALARDSEDEQGNVDEDEDMAISLNAISGSTDYNTFRVKGHAYDKEVQILIDGGSTHCFIDEKAAFELGCKLEPATPMIALSQRSELQMVSAQSMSKLIKQGAYGFVGQVHAMCGEQLSFPTVSSTAIDTLLESYADIFQEPQGLPPSRGVEHQIQLKLDAIPKKMHPYRYSFAQKNEIEKIVKELLESGMIQPSQSSFSPVLLIRMRQEDIPKTSFVTHQGHYEYLVMPFGLCNAPSTFQSLMNMVFSPYLRKFILVFFDDILIYSKTWEEHLQQLQLTLEVLRKNQLFAKRSKCDFGKQSVEYLGHIISVNGVATDPSKVECMKSWPLPKDVKGLRGSWGLRALPDFAKPFVVETDACDKGIGAVLMQDHRPIAYLSKALGPRTQGLSVYEKEFLAILLAYRKGCENKAADALSRREHPECAAVTVVIPNWVTDIVRSYDGDDEFLPVIQAKSIDDAAYPMFSLQGGVLRKEGRICVGKNTDVRRRIVQVLHDSSIGGHSGINGTYQRVRSMFFWGKLKEDVVQWIQSCDVCQKAKAERVPYPGLLQPLPVPHQAWSSVSMDFVEGLPKSEGRNCIMVVVDRFTKYSHFLALTHPFSAELVARIFMDNVYKLHGLPTNIVTDRDKIFTSSFWKELFKLLGTNLNLSTAYHPQSDGQTERVNQCVENYLRCMCHLRPSQWHKWLSLAEYWYNTNFHTGLKLTPFQALYGYVPGL